MPSYTVVTRVVLHEDDAHTKEHKPDGAEYDVLHEEMWKRGYRRFFEGASGKLRKLPPGEYKIY
ncbi:MAG TPA: hypothetical protein VHV99_12950, partial [Paraburkholderia sp.]|nr:hypothetical protein [Paraburkholderia sp.]